MQFGTVYGQPQPPSPRQPAPPPQKKVSAWAVVVYF
jgi:hypothetical protein